MGVVFIHTPMIRRRNPHLFRSLRLSGRILSLLLAGSALSVAPALNAELLWEQPSTELPAWVRSQVIYEVNVRQYSQEGTFAAVEADLPRLEALGVNTLWFMPVHPIGVVNRKGELGSYYSVKDYKGINPEFGTLEDFKRLVAAAHKSDMRVIIDWVGNHTAWDNPLTRTNPEFYIRDAQGSFVPPTGTDWTDVIQLDFAAPGLLDYQVEAMRFWLEEVGIDGFRCDFAVGVPTPFWDELAARLRTVNPEVFLLAEAEKPDHQLKAFDASYGWAMMHAFNDIAQGRHPAYHLDVVLARTDLEFPAGYTLLQLTSNHDENTWNGTVFERLGGGVRTFAVLSMTLDGIPLVYNGQEVGLDRRLLFFEHDPIEWTDTDGFTPFYKKLIDLKTASPALLTGAPTERLHTTKDTSIYSFVRGKSGEPEVLVIANLTARDLVFEIGSERLGGTWTDLFTGETETLTNSEKIALQSWGYKVLVRQGNAHR